MCAGAAILIKTDKITAAEHAVCALYFKPKKTAKKSKKPHVYDENLMVKAGDKACTAEICLSLKSKRRESAEASIYQLGTNYQAKETRHYDLDGTFSLGS